MKSILSTMLLVFSVSQFAQANGILGRDEFYKGEALGKCQITIDGRRQELAICQSYPFLDQKRSEKVGYFVVVKENRRSETGYKYALEAAYDKITYSSNSHLNTWFFHGMGMQLSIDGFDKRLSNSETTVYRDSKVKLYYGNKSRELSGIFCTLSKSKTGFAVNYDPACDNRRVGDRLSEL